MIAKDKIDTIIRQHTSTKNASSQKQLYMPANPKNIKLLLQKRAIRAINKAKYNSHTEPLFKRSKILKLNDLYEQIYSKQITNRTII